MEKILHNAKWATALATVAQLAAVLAMGPPSKLQAIGLAVSGIFSAFLPRLQNPAPEAPKP